MVGTGILLSRYIFLLLIVASFFAVPSTGECAEITEQKLSLAECITKALSNSSSAKKAENNLKLQGTDVLKSYGSFLPRLSLSAGYTPYALSRSYILDTPVTEIFKTTRKSVDLTITTSLNLFNGFRDYASLQSSLKKESAAEYTLARVLESVVFDVTQAYFQVLLDRELLDISRENLLSSQDQLTLIDRQFKVGLKSMTDRYQQESETEQSHLSVIKAETRMERSMFELKRRLQMNPDIKVNLLPNPQEFAPPPDSKPNVDSLVALALQRRGDLKSKSLETTAAQWQIKAARASWYPTLDLNVIVTSGGVEYLNHEYSYPPLSEQFSKTFGSSAGVRFSWLLFDGFQTRYAVEGAKINLLNQQFDYEDLKRNIVIDLHQAAGDYTSAWTQIETAKVSFSAARSAFEAVKRKYQLGAASFVELSLARATLFNARSTLSQATYNLALQKSVLDFTTGKPVKP